MKTLFIYLSFIILFVKHCSLQIKDISIYYLTFLWLLKFKLSVLYNSMQELKSVI